MAVTRRPTPNRPKFNYKGHTADDLKRRASMRGSAQDSFTNQDVKFFTPRAGDNRVRIMPPTWPTPEHYGFDLFVHYNIGPDNSSYICLDKISGEVGVCPICIERARAEAAGEKEYADSLKPNRRVSVYVIDRDRPNEGVLLWNMPWTIDRDICAQAVDKSTGEVYNLDDPDNGYDVLFTREGQNQLTKYVGVQIARKPSPLSDDPDLAEKWLQHVTTKPIPDQFIMYEPDHITKVFAGAAAKTADEDAGTDTEAPAKPAASPAPRRQLSRSRGKEDTELTREAVLAMSEDDLVSLIESRELADGLGDDVDTMPLPELASAVADALGLEAAKPTAGAASSSLKDRLAKLRGNK